MVDETCPWVILRVKPVPYAYQIDYRDSRGSHYVTVLQQESPPFWSMRREEIRLFIDELRYGRVRLPVFIAVPSFADFGLCEQIAQDFLQAQGLEARRIQTVLLGRGVWERRAPFRLPLDVLTVGGATGAFRDAIRSRPWLEGIVGKDAGLIHSGDWIREIVRRRLRGIETDMLVCERRDLRYVLLVLRLSHYRPRLVVALTEYHPFADYGFFSDPKPAELRLADGISLLMLGFDWRHDSASAALVELLRDFAHDLPLHELGRRLDKNDNENQRSSLLISHPDALQSLRLSDAESAIAEEAMAVSSSATPDGLAALFDQAEGLQALLQPALDRKALMAQLDRLGESLVSAKGHGAHAINPALESARSYLHESEGLVPFARLRREVARQRAQQQDIQNAVSAAWDKPELRAALIENQGRRVDIAMQRQNPDKSGGKFVEQRDILAARTAYHVRVQIGLRSPVSILSGEPPPIDVLLPPPEQGRNHILHIAFYSDDFDVKPAILQRLELPEAGPSQPVYFEVVPRQAKENAQARLAVYYDLPPGADGREEQRNHLIQSFMLRARVGEQEGRLDWDECGVEATLDFSLTERFVDLEALKPRVLSLALNDGPGLESHTLMMKGCSEAVAVGFAEAEIADSINSLRTELEWAGNNDQGDGPRFPAGKTGKQEEFDKVVWALAKRGGWLHKKLFLAAQGAALIEAIRSTINRSDDMIQVVQLALNYPFPWPLLYDFKLPKDIVGAPPPAVCQGFLRKHEDGKPYSCQQCLADCRYPDKQKTVCVYGFWGSRHQTEQLVSIEKGYVKPESLKPVGDGSVGFMLGINTPYVAPIPQDLAENLAHSQGSAREINAEKNLVDMLWDDAQRPAILLLVGHYMTKDIIGQPPGPRITLPAGQFLQPGEILDKIIESADWKDPHTVVLLAACQGGVVEIKESVNFVSAFLRAGAGAVIGPEAKIYDGLARSFGVYLSTAMIVEGMTVGAAMLAFRRKLLLELNPLGFAFTAYGFADLAPPKKPSTEVTP